MIKLCNKKSEDRPCVRLSRKAYKQLTELKSDHSNVDILVTFRYSAICVILMCEIKSESTGDCHKEDIGNAHQKYLD